jgi:hypothetical protein
VWVRPGRSTPLAGAEPSEQICRAVLPLVRDFLKSWVCIQVTASLVNAVRPLELPECLLCSSQRTQNAHRNMSESATNGPRIFHYDACGQRKAA